MYVARTNYRWQLVFGMILLGIVLSACTRATPSPTVTPTPLVSPTPFPTRTPTPHPLASQENPLVIGLLSENGDAKVGAAGEQLAQILARVTNFEVQSRVYTTNTALYQDLRNGRVHIVFLQPFAYVYAQEKGWVRPALLTNHFGVYQYGAQFMANVNSKFTIYYDPAKGQNTSNAQIALKQFQNMRPCWVDPTSASGYVAPLGLLTQQGVPVKNGVMAQSHNAVVRALYIGGICDFGATFATTGDPRTSTAITQDLTDVMNRIVIIYQLDPIIPNINISYHSSLPKEMRDDLSFALQNLVKDQKQLLSTAANYEITDLRPLDDSQYDALRLLLKSSSVDLETLIGK